MPLQRYVSSELTHFVGGNLRPDKDKQFDLLIKVIETGILSPEPDRPEIWGNFAYVNPLRNSEGEICGICKVCFCDIPVDDLNIHVQKYSEFGLAFPKSFLVERGASPVFYVARNATVFGSHSGAELGAHFLDNLGQLITLLDSLGRAYDLRLFLVHQVLGYLKPFDSRNAEHHNDNYYMEREWRILGGVRFAVEDVCRIIIPRAYARRFRDRLPSYYGQISFTEENEPSAQPVNQASA